MRILNILLLHSHFFILAVGSVSSPLAHLLNQETRFKSQMCPLGYNELDFFWKIKNTDPLMGAKLKSKTHLLYRFLNF
jgi:hypothetical protein